MLEWESRWVSLAARHSPLSVRRTVSGDDDSQVEAASAVNCRLRVQFRWSLGPFEYETFTVESSCRAPCGARFGGGGNCCGACSSAGEIIDDEAARGAYEARGQVIVAVRRIRQGASAGFRASRNEVEDLVRGFLDEDELESVAGAIGTGADIAPLERYGPISGDDATDVAAHATCIAGFRAVGRRWPGAILTTRSMRRGEGPQAVTIWGICVVDTTR